MSTQKEQNEKQSKKKSKENRWDPYVCPECRLIFKVQAEQKDVGVKCPGCQAILRIPKKGEILQPLVLTQKQTEPGKTRKRSKQYSKSGEFDETFSNKTDVPPLVKWLVAGTAMLVLIAMGLGWLLTDNKTTERARSEQVIDSLSEPTTASKNEKKAVEEKDSIAEGGGELEEAISDSGSLSKDAVESLDISAIDKAIRKFLEAPDIDALLKLVRHPKLSEERIRRYYRDGYSPYGVNTIAWSNQILREKNALGIIIETKDYQVIRLWVEKENEEWKIDWESCVGWNDIAWEQLFVEKPKDPVKLRTSLQVTNYYNFDFGNEKKWLSYRLEHPDSDRVLYGYAPRESVLGTSLDGLNPEEKLILKIRYPDSSVSDNQVIIEEIVSKNWYNVEQK